MRHAALPRPRRRALLFLPIFKVIRFAVLGVPLQALLAVLAVVAGARRLRAQPDGKERRIALAGLILGVLVLVGDAWLGLLLAK